MVFKAGVSSRKARGKGLGGKMTMRHHLEQTLLDASKKGDRFEDPFQMVFRDPADPKCTQCTEPECAKDALENLEESLGMVKPDNSKSVAQWLNEVMEDCKSCKADCMNKTQTLATNKKPEWCLERQGQSFCARGGGNHDCPKDHRFGIPNHGDGRKTLIWNVLRWSRFRGQARRIAMLAADR